MEHIFKVGDITNKGIIDEIFDRNNLSIDGELYNLDKHSIKIMEQNKKDLATWIAEDGLPATKQILAELQTLNTMQNEIIEGNKLIAEFMGAFKCSFDAARMQMEGNTFPNFMYTCYNDDFQYHSSWDWLMPVVEKIENLNNKNSLLFYVSISGDECEIRRNDFPPHDTLIVIKSVHKNKLQSVWLAVVDFIKWYNTLKQTV